MTDSEIMGVVWNPPPKVPTADLLAALAAAGLGAVVVSYDGSGDSGDVDWVRGHRPGADPNDFYDEAEGVPLAVDLARAAGDAVMGLLNDRRGGWETDCGAAGRGVLEVATGRVAFEHTIRAEIDTGFTADLATGQEVG